MKRELAMLLIGSAVSCTMAGPTAFCVTPDAGVPDDSTAGVQIPIEVTLPGGSLVDALTVELDIDHPWVGDLVVSLASPDGSTVLLLDRPGIPGPGGIGTFPGPFGCGGSDVAAVFSDDGPVPAESVCSPTGGPVIAGAVSPSEQLALFAGADASGTWVLTVSDRSSYDAGVLRSVCLNITLSQACAADLAEPFGVLNFFDVAAFIGLYAQQDPAADLAAPFGAFNFFDVSAYIGAYNTGCP